MNPHISQYLSELLSHYEHLNIDEVASFEYKKIGPVTINGKKYQASIFGESIYNNEAILIGELKTSHLFGLWGTTECMGTYFDINGNKSTVDAYWIMHEVGYP